MTESTVADDAEKLCDRKIEDSEILDRMRSESVGNATRSQEMDGPLASCSNSRVQSLDATDMRVINNEKCSRLNSVASEVACFQQLEQTAAAKTMPSSSSSSSLALSSSFEPSHEMRLSESQRSVAESAEERREFHSANEASSETHVDKCNYSRDAATSHSSTTAYHRPASRDASTAENTQDTAYLGENHCSVSHMQHTNDDKTDATLTEQSPSIAVTKQSASKPASSFVGSDENEDYTLNGSGQTRNTLSTESRTSEDKRPETNVEHTNCVHVGRGTVIAEHGKGKMMQADVKDEGMNGHEPRPPLSTHPASHLMTPYSDYDLNCDGDDSSHLEGDATGTGRHFVNLPRTTFTATCTLHCPSPTVKSDSTVCTANTSNTCDRCVSPMSAAVESEECRSTVVEGSFLNISGDLPVASSKTNGPVESTVKKECKFVAEKSKPQELKDHTSTSVADNMVMASKGVRGITDAQSGTSSRVKNPLATAVKPDRKVIANKSENHDDYKAMSYRSSTSVVVKPNRCLTDQSRSINDNDSGFCVANAPTTVSAAEKQERGSTVEKVAFTNSDRSFSAAPNEMNDLGKYRNSSERKRDQLRVLTTDTDGGNHPSVEDRIRAGERERARTQLQSFLSPLCRNDGPPPNDLKPPTVNRNTVTAAMSADWRETAKMPARPPPHDVIRDSRVLSNKAGRINVTTSNYPGRPTSSVLPSVSRQFTATVPRPSVFHADNNNNNKQAAGRDVIKMTSPTTSRSGGDELSSWQRKQVLYDVTILLSPTLNSSSAAEDDQNNRRRQFSEHSVGRDVSTLDRFPMNRTAAVFRRSLSLPVVDRSEAFIVSSPTAEERDRVRIPHSIAHR